MKLKKEEPRKPKKIAIVGYAPSSRELAPYADPDFEIWGVNELYKLGKRITVLFELHERKWLTSKERNPKHLDWLQNSPIPVYMIDHYEDIPASIKFPLEEVKRLTYPYDYFTNSISFMIAMAILILQPGDTLGVWGVDMATDEEYNKQRPSVEFYLGLAMGKGINVVIPPQCDLLKCQFTYGYQDTQITQMSKKIKARIQELQMRAQGYQRAVDENNRALNQMLGAIDDNQYWQRDWQPSNHPLDEIEMEKMAVPEEVQEG